MFCCKCGKTLPIDAVTCPGCGQPVGESRFTGSSYTSAQEHILPGKAPSRPVVTEAPEPQNYTKASYTSMGDEAVQGDADARTSYRPVYEGASAPEDIRSEMRATVRGDADGAPAEGEEAPAAEAPVRGDLSDEAQSALNDVDAQLKPEDSVDLSRFRARPIESAGQSGISSDVSEYIQKLESDAPRRPSFRRRPADYDDYETAAPADGEYDPNDQSEVFEDMDDDELDELRHSGFGLKDVLKFAAVLVVVAALFVGGVMWFRHVRGSTSSSTIANVGQTLYDEGLALIKTHASDEYTQKLLSDYTASGDDLTALLASLDASAQEIQSLTPENATEEETLYVNALSKIEKDIANCLTSDALAVSQNDAASAAQSDERWAVVTNSITALEAARSTAELTAIESGESVEVVQAEPTPEPTPEPVNYNTLSKGDKSDEVLDMQNRLFELGFLLDDRDGAFGSKTQTAVKMFQQVAGLPITGIADSATLNALYADDAPRTSNAQPTPTPPTQYAAEPTPEPAAAATDDPSVGE